MPELLKGLLIALAASGLTLGAHQLFVAKAVPTQASAVPAPGARDDEVMRAIARLGDLLMQQHPQLAGDLSVPAEAFTGRRVAEGSPSDLNEFQEILERLAVIELKLRARPTIVRELQPLNRLRVPDVAAIRAAIAFHERDRESFEFDLHMRTMQEIVQRFGYPGIAAASGGGNSDVYWEYALPSKDPDNNPNHLTVYFKGGLVVWIESHWEE